MNNLSSQILLLELASLTKNYHVTCLPEFLSLTDLFFVMLVLSLYLSHACLLPILVEF